MKRQLWMLLFLLGISVIFAISCKNQNSNTSKSHSEGSNDDCEQDGGIDDDNIGGVDDDRICDDERGPDDD